MKRFLLLTFVLAVNSISRAALTYMITSPLVDFNVTWNLSPDGTQLIGYGTAAGPYSASLDVVGGCGSGTLSLADTDVGQDKAFTLAAGVASAADYFPYMEVSSQSVGDFTQTIGVPWFVFDIDLRFDECLHIAVANEANGWVYGVTVKILRGMDHECPPVPEPITIALLGFGALFLRRRKYAVAQC